MTKKEYSRWVEMAGDQPVAVSFKNGRTALGKLKPFAKRPFERHYSGFVTNQIAVGLYVMEHFRLSNVRAIRLLEETP